MHRHRLTGLVVTLVLLLSASVQASPPEGQPVGGIRCQATEQLAYHIHQHVAIFDRGKPVPIPADVGRPLFANCFYWLHTHTPDGIIHVESPTYRQFTLGDFFNVWGQPLSRTQVATARVGPNERMRVWVNGSGYSGDPRGIQLFQHTDITIEVGPPWRPVTKFTEWNGN